MTSQEIRLSRLRKLSRVNLLRQTAEELLIAHKELIRLEAMTPLGEDVPSFYYEDEENAFHRLEICLTDCESSAITLEDLGL